jgi:flagellar hook-length control protein FliK
VIQISSPTQGPGSPQETGNRQENLDTHNTVEGIFGNSSIWKGAQKKTKQGTFAKLLQGLSVKLTKGKAVKDSSESSETEEPSPDSLEKTAKKNTGQQVAGPKVASLARNAKSAPFGIEIPDGENPDIGFFDVSMLETGLESAETRLGNLRLPELSQKNDNLTFLNAVFPNETESKKSDLVLETLEMASPGGREQSGNKAKNGRDANFLYASFRDKETDFSYDQALNRALSGKSGSNFVFQGAEKENAAPAETRGRRGKERLNIEVRDLRTAEGQGGTSAVTENTVSLKTALESNFRPFSNTEIEIPVELDLHKGSVDGKAGDSSIAGRTFEDALAAELRGNLSTDIVRDAAVIIRNGGEGTIRLSLRPASLGDVKIRLEMTENKITGHIILKSSEALRAFERELPVLEKAFKDSGFSETNLEMFLASDDSANGGAFGRREERQERDYFISALAASRYETEFEQSAISRPDEGVHDGMSLFTSPGRIPVNLLV